MSYFSSHFLKVLNNLRNPMERLYFFQKEDNRMQTIIKNLTQMNEIITIRYSTYDKHTKADINHLAEQYKRSFPDYRSAMIKNSKKVDLPQTLIAVNNRMIENAKSFYIESDNILERIQKEVNQYMKRQNGKKILEKIYSQKEAYIRSFDSTSEGLRGWECLVSIVEDGTIGLKDLPEYGIDIEGISE